MDITFRDADRSSIETIVGLMVDYYAYDRIPFDRGAARSSLDQLVSDRDRGMAWVILSGEEAIGYCVLTLGFSIEFHGRIAVIDELFLRPSFRGNGIGRRALAFLKEASRSLGAAAVRLEVERKNIGAHGLYRAEGFEDHDRNLMTCRLEKPLSA